MSAAKRNDEKVYEIDYAKREREFWEQAPETGDMAGVDYASKLYSNELDTIDRKREAYFRSNKRHELFDKHIQRQAKVERELDRLVGLDDKELERECMFCEWCGEIIFVRSIINRKYLTCGRGCSENMNRQAALVGCTSEEVNDTIMWDKKRRMRKGKDGA